MSNIKARECRFVFHIPATNKNMDTHIVKEIIHYDDGTKKSNLKIVTNFRRPFWVTMEHHRNHKQKKESEDIDKLNKYLSTESDLARAVASRLGPMYNGVKDLRTIRRSPYVYGIDVSSRTYIKHEYLKKYPDIATPYKVCVLDTEVNTITNELTIISIATKEKILTVITKKFLQQKITTSDNCKTIEKEINRKLKYLYDKHVPDTDMSRNIDITYKVVDTELDAILLTFKNLHKWNPDIVTLWNITYDTEVILNILKKNNIDPAEVYCDPNLPKELKRFEFKMGPTQKVTESGKYKPINPEEQWHTIYAPANFYWIDAMSAHRYIRVGGKTIPGGYSLDNILNYELGSKYKKLKFNNDTANRLKGIEWHQYMTKEHPLEYIIYNQWDVMSILELDDKTKDLQQVMPMLSGISNFDIFNSGPKRIIDSIHFFYIENGRVLSTKPPVVDDKDLLGLGSWIVLLPSYRITEQGSGVLTESDNITNNIRMFVYDSDQVSGYPSNTQAANVSADTTLRELKSIEGMTTDDFRTNNINLLFGKVNSMSYGKNMFKLPSSLEIIKELDNIE